jgi:NADPH:quinone reductase-like Zn-dependent oxidoreductase
MDNFNVYLKEQELLMNEDFSSVVNAATSIATKLKDKAVKMLNGLNYEKNETNKMLKTFFQALKDKLKNLDTVTDDDMKQAINQLAQVGKFVAIAPLFLLPGGGTTTTVLYLLGKKFFGISILPKGLESVFEAIQEMTTLKTNLQIVENCLNE